MSNPTYDRLKRRAQQNALAYERSQQSSRESNPSGHSSLNEHAGAPPEFMSNQVASHSASQISNQCVGESEDANSPLGNPRKKSDLQMNEQLEGEATIAVASFDKQVYDRKIAARNIIKSEDDKKRSDLNKIELEDINTEFKLREADEATLNEEKDSNSEEQDSALKEAKSNEHFNNAVKKSLNSSQPSVFATSSNTPPPSPKGVSPDVWAESEKEMNKQRGRIKAGEQQRASEIEAMKKQALAIVAAKENARRAYLNGKDYAREQASINASNTQDQRQAPKEDKGLSI